LPPIVYARDPHLGALLIGCMLTTPYRYYGKHAVATACCIVCFRGRTCVARCGTTRPSSWRSTHISPSSTSGRWACAHVACTIERATYTWHAACSTHVACSMQQTRGIGIVRLSVSADDRLISHCACRAWSVPAACRVCRIFRCMRMGPSVARCALSGRDSIVACCVLCAHSRRCMLHLQFSMLHDVRRMPHVAIDARCRCSCSSPDRSLSTATTKTPCASCNQQTNKQANGHLTQRHCFGCVGVRPDYGVRPRNSDGAP
jgi:hypothetical protein